MAPRSPRSLDCSDELRRVAALVFDELYSAVDPPPAAAALDRIDRDHSGPGAVVDLLISQGILCCTQIHRIGSASGPPDEELVFLNLSMLDVTLIRIADLMHSNALSARLEQSRNSVQELMLRIAKDHGPLS